MAEPQIKVIMEKVGEGRTPDCFKLWACRGAGKGCTRNKYRRRLVHCDDCVETSPHETLASLKARMDRGDA